MNDAPNAMMDRQRREEFPSHQVTQIKKKEQNRKIIDNIFQVGYVDFICEPLYEHLVHQEHLEYLKHVEAKETNNVVDNGPIWTSLEPMLEGEVT